MTADDDARNEALAEWAGSALRRAPASTDGMAELLARIAREPVTTPLREDGGAGSRFRCW